VNIRTRDNRNTARSYVEPLMSYSARR
jgi:hypothetical protein